MQGGPSRFSRSEELTVLCMRETSAAVQARATTPTHLPRVRTRGHPSHVGVNHGIHASVPGHIKPTPCHDL